MKVRRPAVAGSFYDGVKEQLIKQIESCFLHKLGPGRLPKLNEQGQRRVVGLICPHAGYMYSGPTAAFSYHRLSQDGVPEVVVLVGPNHTGMGAMVSVSDLDGWRTPLGDIQVDKNLAKQIVQKSGVAEFDNDAHMYEHSLEVQLPFLQYIYGLDFKIVPITMALQDLATCRDLGYGIANSLSGRNAVIIASTDFSHYEPYNVAKEKDALAIKAILKMDAQELLSTVKCNNISMCGPGPVAVVLLASKVLGATTSELLSYTTSGDITGDLSAVVGYGSFAVSK